MATTIRFSAKQKRFKATAKELPTHELIRMIEVSAGAYREMIADKSQGLAERALNAGDKEDSLYVFAQEFITRYRARYSVAPEERRVRAPEQQRRTAVGS